MKIKCQICYKEFKLSNKYQHVKSKHHIICQRVIDDIKIKEFEKLINIDPEINLKINSDLNFFISRQPNLVIQFLQD